MQERFGFSLDDAATRQRILAEYLVPARRLTRTAHIGPRRAPRHGGRHAHGAHRQRATMHPTPARSPAKAKAGAPHPAKRPPAR